MAKAQGQFTIIDYNDAITLTGYIGASGAKTQMFTPDNGSYTPDWSAENMVLTPSLFVAGGGGTDKITSNDVLDVKWYAGNETTAITNGSTYELSGAKSHILTIKANVMENLPGIDFRCVVRYKDASTGLTLDYSMDISFSRVVNGTGIAELVVTTPDGNVFKNDAVAALTAKAELWRGSRVDNSGLSFQWYKMDASVSDDQGAGIGWKRLTDSASMYTGCNTSILTVKSAAVESFATFTCIATDASDNVKYRDAASFVDVSDPVMVTITSNGGNIFKNGTGSTVLTALVYRGGVEVDAAGEGTYTWTKYDADGNVDTSWGTAGKKTGKTLSVGGNDVNVKATFLVEVSI